MKLWKCEEGSCRSFSGVFACALGTSTNSTYCIHIFYEQVRFGTDSACSVFECINSQSGTGPYGILGGVGIGRLHGGRTAESLLAERPMTTLANERYDFRVLDDIPGVVGSLRPLSGCRCTLKTLQLPCAYGLQAVGVRGHRAR